MIKSSPHIFVWFRSSNSIGLFSLANLTCLSLIWACSERIEIKERLLLAMISMCIEAVQHRKRVRSSIEILQHASIRKWSLQLLLLGHGLSIIFKSLKWKPLNFLATNNHGFIVKYVLPVFAPFFFLPLLFCLQSHKSNSLLFSIKETVSMDKLMKSCCLAESNSFLLCSCSWRSWICFSTA